MKQQTSFHYKAITKSDKIVRRLPNPYITSTNNFIFLSSIVFVVIRPFCLGEALKKENKF